MASSRLRRAVPPAAILVLIFLFVHACVPKPITDLRAVGLGRVPASAMPRAEGLRDMLMRRGESVVRVSLSGSPHWIGEVRKHALNSYPVVVRCDDRDNEIFALGPYVGRVHVNDMGDDRPMPPAVQYDLYLPASGRDTSEADANAPMPAYDLSRQRLTLCIRIAGGAMHGAYGRSNEVRIDVGRTN